MIVVALKETSCSVVNSQQATAKGNQTFSTTRRDCGNLTMLSLNV